jgi:hypothetical protein
MKKSCKGYPIPEKGRDLVQQEEIGLHGTSHTLIIHIISHYR